MSKKLSNFWTTSDGKKVPYKGLSDNHLKNIIKDGYRNSNILKEAKRRGFDVPVRPVDELTMGELMIWIESFASCALSNNKLARKMSDLYETDRATFMLLLNKLLLKK